MLYNKSTLREEVKTSWHTQFTNEVKSQNTKQGLYIELTRRMKSTAYQNLQNGYMIKQTLILELLFNVIIKILELTTEYMK